MAGIPNNRVLRGGEHPMERDGQLNDTQVRTQVTTGRRHLFNKERSNFGS
jgi:hypothetical protein